MKAGGSGELLTTHVKFIVEPLSIYKSGAPIISVDGSINKWEKKNIIILINAHKIVGTFNIKTKPEKKVFYFITVSLILTM